jgi:hypothetical protein
MSIPGLLALMTFATVPAQGESLSLACEQAETAALTNAPRTVHRVSKERLRIEWSKGVRLFVNSGIEEDGGMEGIRYEYCGSVLGHHLISKQDNGLSTGLLLNTASGKVLPAGHTVIFAPDATRYFAIQQPDGLDGEEWLIYSRAGNQLWQGLSGISAKPREGHWEYFVATLEQPRWSSAGELEATLRCAVNTEKTATVTLRASGGAYQWVPAIECASQ